MSQAKSKAIIISTLIIYAIILIWSTQYFSTPLHIFEGYKYKISTQTKHEIKLESETNMPIGIEITGDKRLLAFQNEKYLIEKKASTPIFNFFLSNPITYDVTYPNGHKYQVQKSADDRFFIVYREDRSLYNSSKDIINDYGTTIKMYELEQYHPEQIVKAAYTEFYGTQGTWWLFFISLNLMTYSCLLLLSRRVQICVFHLQYGLNVVNADPTDCYFVRIKISAVVFIVLAVALFFKSL